MNVIKDYYNKFAPSFTIAKRRARKTIPLLEEIHNERVLDVGCASGYLGEIVRKQGNYVVGIDITKKNIEKAEKILADKGVELVECPSHTFDGSGLKRVTADDKPLHLRLSFAYDGILVITAYVKVEVLDSNNNVVITFKREKSANIIVLLSREKRRAIITQFGVEVFEEIGNRVKEWHESKK